MAARDLERVRALLRLQHPDLAGLDLREVPASGGSQLFRLGEDRAVRMPRTEEAAARLQRQHRWLPSLAYRLPLVVPVPMRIGAPSALFPMHWTVVKWVAGEPEADLPHDHKSVETLAVFLFALHAEAHVDAPAFPLSLASSSGPGPWRWIHGAMGPGVVMQSGGMISGVVGFGELSAGDPAVDLAGVCRALPKSAGARLLSAYGADRDLSERVARWTARLSAG